MTLTKKINDYLHYGYVIPDRIPYFLSELNDYEYLEPTVGNTTCLFQEVFNDSISNVTGSGYCVIPVSGGWDSRILLGYALEALPASRIKTYTFGTKGQLDFEIGKKLAHVADVEHTAFDLNKIAIDWDTLKNSVKQTPWTYALDSFFNKYCYKQMQSNADFLLNGFMGDPLTGGHVYKSYSSGIKKIFMDSQAIIKDQPVSQPGYDPVTSLPDLPKNTQFSDHQLLDLGVRQSHCIAPIVSFRKKWELWDTSLGKIEGSKTSIIAPFTHPKWIHYWLSIPDVYKSERKLYLKFLKMKFPRLSDIPAKDYFGARNNTGLSKFLMKKKFHGKIILHKQYPHLFSVPKEMINYLDFDQAFRKRKDYKEVLNRAFTLLKENGYIEWLNLKNLRDEHMNFTRNHSKAFLLLIGLALNIEVHERV